MDRRRFLFASAGAAVAPFVSGCGPLDQLAPSTPVIASVNMVQLAQAITTQQCEEWCWAACISMIFEFYGHPLAQAEIVAQTYGAVICVAANTTATIGADLSRSWVDDNGKRFTSQVIAAFDPANGLNSLSNAMIVSELSSDHPLLYCNTQHAEVLYSVTYEGSAALPSILEADVIDPWPTNARAHPLTDAELVPDVLGGAMSFLAAVRVF